MPKFEDVRTRTDASSKTATATSGVSSGNTTGFDSGTVTISGLATYKLRSPTTILFNLVKNGGGSYWQNRIKQNPTNEAWSISPGGQILTERPNGGAGVTFDTGGSYTIRCTLHDGVSNPSDTHTIHIISEPIEPCFIFGTQVLLPNNTSVLIETLKLGDEVVSYKINHFGDRPEYKHLISSSHSGQQTTSKVSYIKHGEFKGVYTLNEQLSATFEHPLYIRREGYYLWLPIKDITCGDFLLTSKGRWEEVYSVEYDDMFVDVVQMDVEDVDNYFVGNHLDLMILAHNREIKEPL